MSCCCTARRVHLTCLPARAASASSCGSGPCSACSQLHKFCGGKGNRSLWPETSESPRSPCLQCPHSSQSSARSFYHMEGTGRCWQKSVLSNATLAARSADCARTCSILKQTGPHPSDAAQSGVRISLKKPVRSSPVRWAYPGLRRRHRHHRRSCQSWRRELRREEPTWAQEPDCPARRSSCRATSPSAREFP